MFFKKLRRAKAAAEVTVSADRIHGLLVEAVDQRAFNITVGGNGSVEVMKDGIMVTDTSLPVDQKTFMLSIISWLREITADRVPKGLRLKPDMIDLEISVYTFSIDAKHLSIPGIERVLVGIYSRAVSPEAICKGGYVVFKPVYASQAPETVQ